ncbi:MAG: Tetratricopeptide repeat protein [bacterium ADurb.Bin429]|nr:MAG: Tetratricopeptide repeat protein [bacterium ADurb.Bin429]
MTTRTQQLLANAKQAISAQDWLRARLFMEELTHLLPDDPSMAYNRGLVYWKLNEYDNAEAWLRRALELKPDFAQAQAALKFVQELSGAGMADAADAPPVAPPAPRAASPTVSQDIPAAIQEEEWFLGGGFWPRT